MTPASSNLFSWNRRRALSGLVILLVAAAIVVGVWSIFLRVHQGATARRKTDGSRGRELQEQGVRRRRALSIDSIASPPQGDDADLVVILSKWGDLAIFPPRLTPFPTMRWLAANCCDSDGRLGKYAPLVHLASRLAAAELVSPYHNEALRRQLVAAQAPLGEPPPGDAAPAAIVACLEATRSRLLLQDLDALRSTGPRATPRAHMALLAREAAAYRGSSADEFAAIYELYAVTYFDGDGYNPVAASDLMNDLASTYHSSQADAALLEATASLGDDFHPDLTLALEIVNAARNDQDARNAISTLGQLYDDVRDDDPRIAGVVLAGIQDLTGPYCAGGGDRCAELRVRLRSEEARLGRAPGSHGWRHVVTKAASHCYERGVVFPPGGVALKADVQVRAGVLRFVHWSDPIAAASCVNAEANGARVAETSLDATVAFRTLRRDETRADLGDAP